MSMGEKRGVSGARRATGEVPETQAPGPRGRWSARRKASVVLELLRGEDLETVSRRYGVTAVTLSAWRDAFLAAGEAGLRPRGRYRERRDAAAEDRGGRSAPGQRTVAREDSPDRGQPPFGVAEVEAMSRTASPSVKRVYGVACVLRVWELPRSSFYHRRGRLQQPARAIERRGPKTAHSDAELTEQIRAVLAESPFTVEGHRKVWARLRDQREIRTSKGRVLRLMREAELLAPARVPAPVKPNLHTGVIVTEEPNQMWGTDATATVTIEEGQVTVFVALDHCTAECVGIHAAKPATRFEALEPLRQGVREMFGGFGAGVAVGERVRH